MKRATLLIISLIIASSIFAIKSPHGDKLKINCTVCHTTANWNTVKTNEFNHNKTRFPLVGQHKAVSCKKCHPTLVFDQAPTNCSSCHTDMHQGTVGNDCERCHTSNTWIVTKVKQIHRESGFALVGAHATADCNRCHKSASTLRFDNISTDCFTCHKEKYYATAGKQFDHQALGFDTDCARCHNMGGIDWSSNGKGFNHGFFPLQGGHNLACDACHIDNDYKTPLSSECKSCHGVGNSNPIPAHKTKFKEYDCNHCHTIQGWSAGVKFKEHDGRNGKIYSGNHKGKWSSCTDCHTNDTNFKADCRKCHNWDSSQKNMD